MSPPSAPVRTEQQWLDLVRAQFLRGDLSDARSNLELALHEYPESPDLRRILAGVHLQAHRGDRAEELLRELLNENAGDAGSAFALARLLADTVRPRAAAQVMLDLMKSGPPDVDLVIKAIEFLDDADRKHDAATVTTLALAAAPGDPRLHAYAGMLDMQLGNFSDARSHYLQALRLSPQACEWNAPLGLANTLRYTDSDHPDFALLNSLLQREGLSEKARSGLLFALGKAHDDTQDYANAAGYFREANAASGLSDRWSRKDWRRAAEARLASPLMPAATVAKKNDFMPVFIVGMPRSGTTLLAELLARHPEICNRGELPTIGNFAQEARMAGIPELAAIEQAANDYRRHITRDDSDDARWFIDKQPLNFRYVDLILALFPSAKIIHCRRNARDNALSLWMQSFNEPVQAYACDFDDIALVMRDCTRLMKRWRERFPESIRTVDYESLVSNPQATVIGLSEWIGLPSLAPAVENVVPAPQAISSASLWQARQPVHRGSMGRWKNYAPYVPELERAIPEAENNSDDNGGN